MSHIQWRRRRQKAKVGPWLQLASQREWHVFALSQRFHERVSGAHRAIGEEQQRREKPSRRLQRHESSHAGLLPSRSTTKPNEPGCRIHVPIHYSFSANCFAFERDWRRERSAIVSAGDRLLRHRERERERKTDETWEPTWAGWWKPVRRFVAVKGIHTAPADGRTEKAQALEYSYTRKGGESTDIGSINFSGVVARCDEGQACQNQWTPSTGEAKM